MSYQAEGSRADLANFQTGNNNRQHGYQGQGRDGGSMPIHQYPDQGYDLQDISKPVSNLSTGQKSAQSRDSARQGHPQYSETGYKQPSVPGGIMSNNQQHRHGGAFEASVKKATKLQKRHAGAPDSGPVADIPHDRSAYQDQNYHGPGNLVSWSQTDVVGPSHPSASRVRYQQDPDVAGSSNCQPLLAQTQPRENGSSRNAGNSASTSAINRNHIQKAEKGILLDSLGRDSGGRTRQRNDQNYFHSKKIRFLKSIVEPGIVTMGTHKLWFKDILQREKYVLHEENSFLHPNDGRLTKLVVQATDLVFDGPDNTTWRRTFVRNTSPLVVKVANWAIDHLDDRDTTWTTWDWIKLIGKWISSCLAVLFLVPFCSLGKARNGGHYDSIPYKDWNYCLSPRNTHEVNPGTKDIIMARNNHLSLLEQNGQGPADSPQPETDPRNISDQDLYQHFNPESNRTLRPRYLCVLNDPTNTAELRGFRITRVERWMKRKGLTSHPEYLFVAYTTNQFDCNDTKDREVLLNLAETATRDAGLEAFWLASTCLRDTDENGIIEDVWRMSDVVRGASAVVIVIGHPVEQRGPSDVVHIRDMLLGWGKRMWTLPEALLSPKGTPIKAYIRGMNQRQSFEKRSLAVQIWQDAAVSRQLIDHFEGSVILSPLELVVIALRCLNNRDTDAYDIDSRIKGEMAYVLMGLLRRRPRVDMNDSAFQAFARLSLANDSHLLLERLVCVMPKVPNQRWHDTTDYWDAQLWDIYPSCQIAGIGHEDSIILDGAVGASIRWDRFEKVAYTAKNSLRRTISRYMVQFSPLLVLVGLPLATLADPTMKAAGIACLAISLAILAASPFLVRLLFTGKLWNTQALLFGFEGYMDIVTIERHIFGASMNRLAWSPFGSALSQHAPGKNGECVGLDPISNYKTRALVEKCCRSDYGSTIAGGRRIFTLVDTCTMTVTMIEAERPPVAVIVCGAEGGMQRAVLCSYHSATHTFIREGVLRMETRVLGRMTRVARLRFCFQRSMLEDEAFR